MNYKVLPLRASAFFIRLDQGEEVIKTLTDFALANSITSGSIQGIGAVKDVTLGYLDLNTKQYLKKSYSEDMELISLLGNFSMLNNKPFLHCHASCSGRDFRPVSGHLFTATVTATGEFSLIQTEGELIRRFDPGLGFNRVTL